MWNILGMANLGIGNFGPKAASIGILLVLAGELLQGHWDKIDADSAIQAMIALGLWGTRANLRSSERVGAK
jgi:hypothetical protein